MEHVSAQLARSFGEARVFLTNHFETQEIFQIISYVMSNLVRTFAHWVDIPLMYRHINDGANGRHETIIRLDKAFSRDAYKAETSLVTIDKHWNSRHVNEKCNISIWNWVTFMTHSWSKQILWAAWSWIHGVTGYLFKLWAAGDKQWSIPGPGPCSWQAGWIRR